MLQKQFTVALLLAICICAAASPRQAPPSPPGPAPPPAGAVDLILAYRDLMNANTPAACVSWAHLFSPNGTKFDAPSPSTGTAALIAFCEADPMPAFAYEFISPIIVTESAGIRATVQWLLGGMLANGQGMVQTGWGSYVLVANTTSPFGYSIAECTGYAIIPPYDGAAPLKDSRVRF